MNAPTGSTNPLPSVGFPLPISAVLNRHWTDGGIYGVGATLDFSLTTPGGAVSQISAGPTNISGVATATFPAPAATGNYTATASFAGNDALNGGVTSPVGTITVRQRTQVTMSAGVASQNVSSPVSATVVAIPSGQPVGPGRMVTFTTAGATINTATATTNAAGVATANFTWSTLGAKTVTASYTPTVDELNRNGLAAADSSAANTDVQAAVATTIVLGAFTGTRGTPVTLGATLRNTATSAPVAGATVTFAQVGGGNLGSGITQADGTVSVAFTPAAAVNGQYTASFTGMPGYAASSATAAYTIVAATTAVSDLTIAATNFVGDTVAISATLTRTSAPAGAAAGQAVTFTLTGDAGNPGGATVQTLTGTTNAAGIAQVSFPATARGQFTVNAAFAGSSSLAPSTSGNASATVYQKVTLSLQPATGVTGVPAQLSAQLVTVPGSVPLSGQTISFSLAPGSPANPTAVTAADGVALATTTFGAAGSYTVSAHFQSASAFYANALGQVAPAVASGIVAINRATSALSTPLITSGQPIVGQPVAVRSVLSRVTNPAGPVAGLVTFTFTGPGGSVTSLATSAGADGVASTTFNATARGPYTVSASFAGSSSLDASTSAATAFSATQNTTLTLAPVSAIAGGQATVSATLIASPQNTPVAGQIVNFSFGGAALSTDAVTDANGVAFVAVSFPSATFVSAHATFNAANDYAGSTADAGIAVASAQTALSPLMVPSTSLVGDTLTVATTLTRTSVPAGVVANVPLTFRLASPGVTQTVSAMTDANGLAQASFTLVNRGAFSVTVQFAGDTALEAAQRSADLSVYQRTNLVVNAATGVAGALTPISATLLTIPGNTPLAGQTVDFSFNGVVPPSSATTDGNGTGGVSSVFVSGGTFPVTASFSNLADYFVDANGNAIPTTASTNLTIARATTSLGALSAPSFSAVSNVLTVSTTLTRTSAPAGPAAGETVFFTVTAPDGSTTFSGSAVSAANGQVSFVFTPVMKGAHTISASFAATAGLDASSANAVSVAVYQRTTLTVAPATGSATKPFTVSATLATMPGGAPIAGQPVSFSFTDGSWATATTNAQGVAQVTVTIAAVGDYTATATFSDAAGFYADSTGAFPVVPTTGSGVVHVTNNPPAFTAVTVPAVEATSPNGAAVMFTAGGNDAEDGPLNAVCAPASGSIFAVGQTTVSCTVTDSAQATATGSFIVTVQDTTAPVVTVPTIAPAFAASAAGRVIDYTASAADIVDGSTATACVPVSGSIFALGQTTVTCTSSDSRGNTASAAFVVTINNNAPTFTAPADITKEATGATGAIATFAPMGGDVEDGQIAAVCVPASGSTFPIGASTVSCTVTDAANLTAAATFTVTVGDTTAPVLTLPVIAPASATSAAGRPVTFSATAVDIVDATPTVVCVPASGSIFPIGDTTVTCTATDDNNNSKSGTFTVTVTNNAPTFAPPSSITTEATSANGAVVSFTAEGNDLEEGTLQAVCAPASGSTFPLGATTVSCTVTDVAQATATGSFTVTVGDTTAPVLTLPMIAPAFATSANGNVVNYTATALDIVDGSTAVTCSPASGSTFPIATTTVNCSTSDTRGNTSTGSFTVSITNTAPTIVDLPNLAGEATSAAGRAFTFTSTGNDNEDGPKTPVCTASSGTFPIGTTTVSCTVTDVAGATATDSFTITVVDTTKPVVTVPANITTTQNIPAGRVVTYSGQSATDAVTSALITSCVPASGSTFAVGTTTVTCSATDAAGNTGTNTFTVTVNPSGTTTVGPGQTMTFSGGTLGGNVNVNGGTLILTNGTTVSGNVQMQPGSTLTVNTGSSVGGNVQLAGTGAVNVTGGTVGGNLQLSNGAVFNIGPGAVMQGQVQLSNTPAGRPTSTMCGASVAKNVQIDGNASPVFIGSTPACAGNTIAGQVQIQSNTAAIRVFGNMISKQLQCSSNTGGITGGGNTASGKSGQCSAF